VIVVADEEGLAFDALAHFSGSVSVIVISIRLAASVREFLINQLLGLSDGGSALTVRIPAGEAVAMFSAPLAHEGTQWHTFARVN